MCASAPQADLARVRRENETLYSVIKTVGSSLDLDQVLGGVVEIATRATDCHACFVYFVEGDRLALRAASPQYAHLVDRLELGIDEGLTGWVARTGSPEFIRDSALEDPRMKYVPELEEERFQSMVAVPVLGRDGGVLGVIVLHTEAPREFGEDALNFLVHTGSLVAGAIVNAQLYEETRHRVATLTELSQLAQSIASARVAPDLYRVVVRGARRLLATDACHCFRLLPDTGALTLVASDPDRAEPPSPADPELLLGLTRRRPGPDGRSGPPRSAEPHVVAAPLAAGDEALGVLCCVSAAPRERDDDELGLLGAVASQAAVGLRKIELIERLTAENLVKDMFEALAAGSEETGEAKAAEAGCDLAAPHVFVHGERASEDGGPRPWPELAGRLEEALRDHHRQALFDAGPDRLRALVPVGEDDPAAAVERLVSRCSALGAAESVTLGLSGQHAGSHQSRRAMREAADAALIGSALSPAGGAHSYEELGAYRYLVHLQLDDAPRDRHRRAVDALLVYDRSRSSELVKTLTQFLSDRGSVAASARALYVHPNTVRQRLERIETVSGLKLADEDLLSLELALKLAHLQAVGVAR